MWNDTDTPLAYLITFRCYGIWLHGDERGSIDRFHNQYESPFISPNTNWYRHNVKQMKNKAVILDTAQRQSVEISIRETCEFRKWILRAMNARTNHVHAVVSIGIIKPERALNDFKSYSTRKLRQDGFWLSEKSPWADKGSIRYLWNERSIELATDYVVNGQGGELPKFE